MKKNLYFKTKHYIILHLCFLFMILFFQSIAISMEEEKNLALRPPFSPSFFNTLNLTGPHSSHIVALFECKKDFWRPSLNWKKTLEALIRSKIEGQSVPREEIFEVIRLEAERGDAHIQQEFYTFFSKCRLPALSFLPNNIGETFLNLGLEQGKSWAFYECARRMHTTNQTEAIRNYLLAFNGGNAVSKDFFQLVPYSSISHHFTSLKKPSQRREYISQIINNYRDQRYTPHLYKLYIELKEEGYNQLADAARMAALDLGFIYVISEEASECQDPETIKDYFERTATLAQEDNNNRFLMLFVLFEEHPNIIPRLETQKKIIEIFLKKSEEGYLSALEGGLIFLQRLRYQNPNEWYSSYESNLRYFEILLQAIEMGSELSFSAALELKLEGSISDAESMKKLLSLAVGQAEKGNFNPIFTLSYKAYEQKLFLSQEEARPLFNWCLRGAKAGEPKAIDAIPLLICSSLMKDSTVHQEFFQQSTLSQIFDKSDEDKIKNIAALALTLNTSIPSELKHSVLDCLFSPAKADPEKFLSCQPRQFLSFAKDLCWTIPCLQPSQETQILTLLLKAAEKGENEALNIIIKFIFSGKLQIAPPYQPHFFNLLLGKIKDLTEGSIHNCNLLFSSDFEWVRSNIPLAIDFLSEVANKNNAQAMVLLAHLYLGIEPSTDENLQAALFWIEKAQSLGHPIAQEYLDLSQKLKPLDSLEGADNLREEAELDALTQKIFQLETTNETLPQEKEQLSNSQEIGETQNNTHGLVGELRADVSIMPVALQKEGKIGQERRFPKNLKPLSNPKTIRYQLRRMGEIKESEKINCLTLPSSLTRESHTIIQLIEKKTKNKIDYPILRKLFTDPYFNNQIILTKTKSGLMVKAHNRRTGEYSTASTHRGHSNTYKGFPKKFLTELLTILKLFENEFLT